MQLPPESDDELDLSSELPKPARRRVERLVDEQRRLRHEEQLAKSRRTRLAQLQLEQDERDATARQQAEAEAQAIPTDPEFAAWLEGRNRGGRGASALSNADAARIDDAAHMDDSADYDSEDALDAERDTEPDSKLENAPRSASLSEVERRTQRAKQARRDWWKEAHTKAPQGTAKGTSSLSSADFGSETISEKRKAKSRARRILRRFAFASVLVLLAGGTFYCFTSPRFNVRSVTVKGQDITPSPSIERAQALLVGHNWARARTSEAQKMLEALPTVRQATVSHRLMWPPQIGIQLYERQPFARVGSGREWWVVDATGVPFRRMNDKARPDRALFPLTGPELIPHEGKPLPDNLWRAAVKMVNVLQGGTAADTGSGTDTSAPTTQWNLRRIYFDRSGAVSLRLAGGSQDGLLVRLGNESWSHKLSMARQALTFFNSTGRRAATLDLSSPDLPSLVSLNRAVWTERAPQADDSASSEARENPEPPTRVR